MTDRTAETADAILRLCRARRGGATICPSEAARAVAGPGWRTLMPEVRRVAADLAGQGAIRVLQKGRPADPATVRGPIRLGLAGAPEE